MLMQAASVQSGYRQLQSQTWSYSPVANIQPQSYISSDIEPI